VRWREEGLDRALGVVKQHGCITVNALALVAGMSRFQAYYALLLLGCAGKTVAYPLGMVHAHCAGLLDGVTVMCGGRIARLDFAKIAAEVLLAVELGTRYVRPSRLESLRELVQCPSVMSAAWSALRAVLGSAGIEVAVRGGKVLAVVDVGTAVERLKQVVETGVLHVEPLRRACPDRKERQVKERMALVTVHVPPGWIEMLDALVRSGAYRSRSEAVRDAVKKLVDSYRGHV
jgi:hypothetical protein